MLQPERPPWRPLPRAGGGSKPHHDPMGRRLGARPRELHILAEDELEFPRNPVSIAVRSTSPWPCAACASPAENSAPGACTGMYCGLTIISVAQCLQSGSCLPSEQAIGFGAECRSTGWRRRKISIVLQRFGILSRHRLPGNPAVCYRPRLGEDGMMMSKISRIIAPVILLLSGPALAQPDARRGLSLARENCEQCHAIDNTSESPRAAAPPFRELRLKYAISDLQRPLTQGPHARFQFEPSQIESLMAYLKTLDR